MFKLLVINLLLFTTALGAAGQSLYDLSAQQLVSRIHKSKPDTVRVKLLLALSRKILFKPGATTKDVDSSCNLAKQAEWLSFQLKDIKSEGSAALMVASVFNKKGDGNKGFALSQHALALFTKINDIGDEAEADILIGQHYGDEGKDMDQKVDYYKKAIALFHKKGEKEREATTMVDLADFQQLQTKYQESAVTAQTALAIYQSIGYKNLQGVYDLLGNAFDDTGDVEKALKYKLKAVNTAEEQRDTSLQLCTLYNRLGLCYYGIKNFGQAIKYFQKSILVARKYRDSLSMASVTQNNAMALYEINKPADALRVLKTVSAMQHFKKDMQPHIAIDMDFLDIYVKLKQYKQAKAYATDLDSLKKYAGSEGLRGAILKTIVRYYLATKQYVRCYALLKEIDEINKRKTGKTFRFLALNQLYWFRADSGSGKYQGAINHYQEYKRFNDSVFTLAKNKQVSLLEIEFDTKQKNKDLQIKEKNIQLLTKQWQLQQSQFEQARTSRNVILGGSVMLLLLLGIGYNRYRLKQRSNLLLQNKQAEINEQNNTLQHLLYDKDKLLNEKDWLLKEVHHRVKNNLQIVMSLLSTQSAYLQNNDAIEAIRESRNRVQSISLIHQKLYSGSNVASIDMPAYVADLIGYLRDGFDTATQGIRFEQLVEPIKIDLAQAVPLGLILNEAITNAIKYAFPKKDGHVIVGLQTLEHDTVLLTISDNGKGLPEDFDIKTSSSLGMEMMKALSKQLGGTFEIKSKSGTTITIEFQLEKVLPVDKTESPF